MVPPPPVRCGPSGWAFPHWAGLVYPSPLPPAFHPVEFLAEHFDVVEIDTSLHAPLKPEISKLWAVKAGHNRKFQFTAKLPNSLTYDRQWDDAEIGALQRGLRPLMEARRLGCLVMEFPWSFRFTTENREFFIRLRRAFHEFPLVAEMRHASWMVDEALGVFIDYHVGFVNVDQPPYIKAMPPTAFLTSPIGYVRLHGRAATQPNQEQRRDYYYRSGELNEWQDRIEHLRKYAREVYVVTTADVDGRSVLNALQMQSMVAARRRVAPVRAVA
jgi:uncharacterized protein YecE (DUF72 family)